MKASRGGADARKGEHAFARDRVHTSTTPLSTLRTLLRILSSVGMAQLGEAAYRSPDPTRGHGGLEGLFGRTPAHSIKVLLVSSESYMKGGYLSMLVLSAKLKYFAFAM
jgi:hypothetical protein